MRVTLNDGRTFDLESSDKILNTEAMAIERVTGWEMQEFLAKLEKQSVLAMTAYIWIMVKRSDPTMRFDDVVFSFDALEASEDVPDPKGDGVST